MRNPLIFKDPEDGRTLAFAPVNIAAQASIDAVARAAPTRRLALARSLHGQALYRALVLFAFERRDLHVVVSARELGDRAGMSIDWVRASRPVLESAGVVAVHERRVGRQQLPHDWEILAPGAAVALRPHPPVALRDDPPSRSAPTPHALRDASRGRVPPAVKKEGKKEDEERAARAQPAVNQVHLKEVLDTLGPALEAKGLKRLVAPAVNCVLAAHPEASGCDHLRAANLVAAKTYAGEVHAPMGFLAAVLKDQARQTRKTTPGGGRKPVSPVSDTVKRGDAVIARLLRDRGIEPASHPTTYVSEY
jgi:hypothetical protein